MGTETSRVVVSTAAAYSSGSSAKTTSAPRGRWASQMWAREGNSSGVVTRRGRAVQSAVEATW